MKFRLLFLGGLVPTIVAGSSALQETSYPHNERLYHEAVEALLSRRTTLPGRSSKEDSPNLSLHSEGAASNSGSIHKRPKPAHQTESNSPRKSLTLPLQAHRSSPLLRGSVKSDDSFKSVSPRPSDDLKKSIHNKSIRDGKRIMHDTKQLQTQKFMQKSSKESLPRPRKGTSNKDGSSHPNGVRSKGDIEQGRINEPSRQRMLSSISETCADFGSVIYQNPRLVAYAALTTGSSMALTGLAGSDPRISIGVGFCCIGLWCITGQELHKVVQAAKSRNV